MRYITRDDLEDILKDLDNCMYKYNVVLKELFGQCEIIHKNDELYELYVKISHLGQSIKIVQRYIKEIMPPLANEHLADEER